MIFSKELDESLWLMLESDKKNRRKVSEFLKAVPSELYEQISIQLDKYREYEDSGIDILERDTICLYGNCLDQNNYKYSFIVDMINHSLSISKSFFRENEYVKQFELTMYAKSRYNSVDVFGRQMLGSIYESGMSGKYEYDLVDMLFGKMIICSYDNNIKKYKRVKINDILDDIRIEDLSSKKGNSRVKKMN